MQKHLLLASACFGAVLGASFVGVRADEIPTPSPITIDVAPAVPSFNPSDLQKKGRTPRSQIPGLSGITSVTLEYPTSSPKDATVLLQTLVAFSVKDASFMGALDAMMGASGKTCRIECRRVLAMKLSFSVKNASVGYVLHTLALAGGCSLYVFPDKLIVAAPDQLSAREKQTARLYGVVQSATDFPPDSPFRQSIKMHDLSFNVLDVASSKISLSINNLSPTDALSATQMAVVITGKPSIYEYRVPASRQSLEGDPSRMTLAIQDMKFGDALAIVAHLSGCALYLLPDQFLVCAPNDLRPDEEKIALRLYTPDSVKFNFDDPSAPTA